MAKKPGEIRVSDIIRVTEGGFDPVSCISPEETGKNCSRISECVTRLVWKELREVLKDFLDSVTIHDLCRKAEILGIRKEHHQRSISRV